MNAVFGEVGPAVGPSVACSAVERVVVAFTLGLVPLLVFQEVLTAFEDGVVFPADVGLLEGIEGNRGRVIRVGGLAQAPFGPRNRSR